jgi:hypothetical protein
MTSLNNPSGKESDDLPYLYWIPKLQMTPCKERYIAGSSTCSTKNCRTVLGESDGVYKPLAIYFGKVKNNLVVCNYNGTASLYKVE